MEINPYSAISSVSGSSSASSRQTVADNFDTFLQLLTTQLQNQDPTDPLDTNQFTQQLVQYTEVEQSVKANENLEKLALLSAANALNGAVSYIGQTVTTSGQTSTLSNGSASWSYTSEGSSDEAVFVVKDSVGNEVYSEKRPITQGVSDFVWNGRRNDNSLATSGDYTLSINATDSSGQSVVASTNVSGVVEGVDMSGNDPVLLVNGKQIKLTEVVSIHSVKSDAQ